MQVDIKNAFVVCDCGGKHRLIRGIDALLYWCGDELREVVSGDYLDFEEEIDG